MNTLLRLMICSLAGSLAASVPAQEAASAKPITLLVGFAPGGGTDQIARIVAPKVSELLKQTVVVENRPGASGAIAAGYAAKAEPDGHTLLMGHISANAMLPAIKSKLPYRAAQDFTPLSVIGSVPQVLAVPATSKAHTVAEFIQMAKARPGALTYASSGPGTQQHFAAELFEIATGTSMTHVPYKGSGAAVTDLISGLVDVNFDTLPSVVQHIKAGKLRALAVTTRQRVAALPDVPTLIESGLPDYEIGAWYMVMGPAGLPPAAVERLSSAFVRAVKDPGVRAKLDAINTDAVASTPEQARRFLTTEIARWASVAQTRNIRED